MPVELEPVPPAKELSPEAMQEDPKAAEAKALAVVLDPMAKEAFPDAVQLCPKAAATMALATDELPNATA